MKRIALVLAVASSALSLAALDFTGSGFTQTGDKTEDGKTIAILADDSGGQVLFDAEADPSPQRLSALKAIVAELRSWSDFDASEIRAVNTADRLQVTALPRKFVVDGVALDQALPGGIQIFYHTATEYDFKVKSGKYLVRVSSVFTTKEELEGAALAAFKDPPSFIATRDPLYVQRRLGELASQEEDLDKRTAALEQVTFDVSNDVKVERTTRAETELAALKAAFDDYKAKVADETTQRETQRDADWQKAKLLLITALNGSKPIKPEAMAKLIELKKADPSLDKKSVPKALKAAGYSLNGSEISAIFLVEFDE